MELCTCCYDEVTGLECYCEEQHGPDTFTLEEIRRYISPRNLEVAEQWSFYCTACNRYTSGTTYYTD